MSHALEALVGQTHAVAEFASRWVRARVVGLPQNFALVPLSVALREDIEELVGTDKQGRFLAFAALSDAVAEAVAEASSAGALAHIETEYFGGVGEQRAVVWEQGRVTLGPLEDEHAVNAALRRLGVWTDGTADEFDTLGLSRFRDTETAGRQAS